jgi:thioredoxin-like negative regulator of GroEL
LLLLAFAAAAPAAEVEWRTDYNAARREAVQKNLPLLVEFGTRTCFWCKKMDAATYRDGTVVGLLNQQFVAVKVDGDRNPFLTQNLKVDGFPTAVLASPDGVILDRVEGFLAPAPFVDHLRKAAAASADWPTRAYAEASNALAGRDYPRAIEWFQRVSAAPTSCPLRARATEALARLEGQAKEGVNQAVQLHQQGREGEARESLGGVARNYPGTHAAADAQGLLSAWTNQERPVQASYQVPK